MLTRAPAQADHLEAEAADGRPAAALGRGTLRAGHLHRHPQVHPLQSFTYLLSILIFCMHLSVLLIVGQYLLTMEYFC